MKNCLLALILLLIADGLLAQSVVIKGVVTGADGKPLEGVSVIAKGTKIATASNGTGSYSISVPQKSVTLVFSSVGYSNREILVEKSTTLNISLKETITEDEEVVVIGYATQRKKDVTGSVAKVNVQDLDKAPVRSFDEALAGRVAGVQVSSESGQPGSGINIVIRGNNSITQDNSPLYVVDGFPIENQDNNIINPKDIESIEVLKDASATAIYGARGANGVIIITTKKGKEGPAVISFDASYGVQNNLRKIPMMSAYDFVKYQIEYDPTPVSPTNFPSPTQVYLANGKTLDDYKSVKGTDWQDLVLRQAPMANYNLSIRGGNAQTKYSISGSVLNQDGIMIGSGYKRYQGRVVLDQTVNSKLKVGINANYSSLQQSGISPSQSVFAFSHNIMVAVWGARPVTPNVDDIENVLQDPSIDPANDYRVNPVINLNNLVRENKTKSLGVNAYAEYAIIPSLKLRMSLGFVDNMRENDVFNNSRTQYGFPGSANGVNGSITFNKFNSWLSENTLTWDKKFNKHQINLLGGFTAQGAKTATYGISADKLPNENLGLSGLDEGNLLPVTATSSLWTMASVLSRLNYSYDSKYLLTASFRADGSSKFSSANHWSYFPSAAASWRFSNEKFANNLKFLSDGKLRVSYGVTGNNRVGDFAYLTTYGLPIGNSYVFNNSYASGIVPTVLGNTDLKWETTKQTDIGLDLGFLNQRILLTVDYYKKTTSNLLLFASLPTSTGFDRAFKNVGSVENQGFEFTLTTLNIKNKNFSWSSNFNITLTGSGSRVLGLAENQNFLLSSINWDNGWRNTPAYIARVGQPLGQMYGYLSDGVYQIADFDQPTPGNYVLKTTVPTNGNTRANIRPGDIKYKDLNGDLVVNANDYTVIGNGVPKHIGGFSNNFTYKDFDLNIFFQWSYGNDILNNNRLLFEGNGVNRLNFNQFAGYANRWSPDNQNSTIHRTRGYFGGGYSSSLVEDGSFLRLKTVSLGYNLNGSVLKRLKIRGFRVYVSAQNLITWTKYTGMDPEVSAYHSALTPGFDYSTYPRARTITFGANISF
ncbi:TonB-dependent receptor [Sediminibacterium sp.]|uniref:SusC/RagA family TonB-linked outer membrane protein n=1 Tax=Sediminibacterium sp. TaxID=1917865 RepID=UPI002736F79F|nr:TonB-dependent receptor [Sediminibacterium sp.]MDP3394603.1 TonB-dependent receptor [Sediminibacterium sp.]MDP3568438.1 TonB-dependent receptor [Sediminibacterium sp.]